MIKRITIGDIRVTFTIAHIGKVIGVNSWLNDGNHILMWDFDDTSLDIVKQALKVVQSRYLLSDIYVLETKEKTNYNAYCFSSCCWRRAVEIVAQTEHVCWSYFKMSVIREHLTLRVTPKQGRTPKLVAVLEGFVLPDCTPEDLKSWVRYETLLPQRGH